ncbi:ABC transporter permease [Plantactinospora sp. GCM10030261]|uniref:ABC transporter permease n=1 Tax=Plantactinospora sp. GCM10030261 TaxID=3273420 RepID=UPI0036210DAD
MSGFTGTARLVRLAVRRDRVRLLIWVLGTPLLAMALAGSVLGIYDSDQDRLAYATTSAASVVARAFNGPVAGASLGAVVTAESYVTLAILVALLSTFAVVRHTRQNEETGRTELLGSAAVGRYALLTSALLVVIGANLASAALMGLALIGSGLPVAGSMLAAGALGAVGVAFTAVAAVTAQVSGTARGANSLAAATVGVAFALRAAGDVWGDTTSDGQRVVSSWPSWLSPLGWGNQVRAYEENRWWVLLLPAGLLLVGVVVAFVLTNRRDVGAGLLADRRGPATAAPALLGPFGLAWRLHRGTLLGWAIGVAIMGLGMGAVADEVNAMVGENAAAAEVISQLGGGDDLVNAFLAAMLAIFALAIGGYATQAVLRARAEEADGRLEPVLGAAVGRNRWLAGHVLAAVLGALVLIVVAGASTGLGYGLAVGEPATQVAELIAAALVHLPAVLVLAGLVVVLFGQLPRLSVPLSWTVLAAFLLMGQLGAVLELPRPVLNLSPFSHVPAVPATDPTATPLVVLTGVAVALLMIGLVAFRRRDVTT